MSRATRGATTITSCSPTRLEALVAWMRTQQDDPFDAGIFVDKHHVQERVYAARAGIGWIGKNACVINPEIGSWILLAGVATSLDLAPDGPCTRSVRRVHAVPRRVPNRRARRCARARRDQCISYLTIELEGPLPLEQRPHVDDHLFGCDICQEVCPWNLAPPTTADPAWQPRRRDGARAAELWQRTDQELHGMVKGSAMMHTSLARLRRNLALIIGNTGEPSLAAALNARATA